MQSDESLKEILDNVVYKRHNNTWTIVLRKDGDRPYLQVRCSESEEGPWSGRKWMLSYHMKTSEVIDTAYKAVMAAEEHEVKEFFHYKGVPVFGPHFDVETKVRLIMDGTLGVDVRYDAMEGA